VYLEADAWLKRPYEKTLCSLAGREVYVLCYTCIESIVVFSAQVMELVDMHAWGACAERYRGSTPLLGKHKKWDPSEN